MKIAVIFNRDSQNVINLFGTLNREKYGIAAIKRIVNALKSHGHQVEAMEGDKALISKLEEFMPKVLKGERPGLAFNLSYGIQGQARYTHVPGILEMLGIPYVGSGPLAHSLSLDKVVAKMIFKQYNIPTPDFTVLNTPDDDIGNLEYPLIVKPKNEAVSMGIKIVHNQDELRSAAKDIITQFGQAVLVEKYIEGREINVGLIGNHPPDTMLPAELDFGKTGQKIYTLEDKRHQSGRDVAVICPAPLSEELTRQAQNIAQQAFDALGCYDCARVDMRLDDQGNLFILEINSLPSLGEHGSYVAAAAAMGMDFPYLVNRLVDVASIRYFGMPDPPDLHSSKQAPERGLFNFITSRRDKMEKAVEAWVNIISRTNDPLGHKLAAERLEKRLLDLGMSSLEHDPKNHYWTWQTQAGYKNGTLIIVPLDIPVNTQLSNEVFHRDPEWLYGEGVGSSRGSLVMLEYACRALRHIKILHKQKIGIMAYSDEGQNAQASAAKISDLSAQAAQVLVLFPGNPETRVVTARRGHRIYRLIFESKPARLGQKNPSQDMMYLLSTKLQQLMKLTDRKDKVALSIVDIQSEAYPRLLPHRVQCLLQCSFPDDRLATDLEQRINAVLEGCTVNWNLSLLADRPPMKDRRINQRLLKEFHAAAEEWSLPLDSESSLWPSVAGLVPSKVPVLCGLGPVTKQLFTNHEKISRISLVERTLLLANFLLKKGSAHGSK